MPLAGMGPVAATDGTLESARKDAYQGDPREMESRSTGEYPEQRFDLLQKRKQVGGNANNYWYRVGRKLREGDTVSGRGVLR